MNCLVNTWLSPVNARLLITCDTAFYAITSNEYSKCLVWCGSKNNITRFTFSQAIKPLPYLLFSQEEVSEFLGGILSQSPLPQEIVPELTDMELKKKKKKRTSKEMGDELDGISYSVSIETKIK